MKILYFLCFYLIYTTCRDAEFLPEKKLSNGKVSYSFNTKTLQINLYKRKADDMKIP